MRDDYFLALIFFCPIEVSITPSRSILSYPRGIPKICDVEFIQVASIVRFISYSYCIMSRAV